MRRRPSVAVKIGQADDGIGKVPADCMAQDFDDFSDAVMGSSTHRRGGSGRFADCP
jgi:hypothetical protein